MVDEIVALVDRLDADDGIGALVVTGAPPAFCAGANLANLGESGGDGGEASLRAHVDVPAGGRPADRGGRHLVR